MDSRSLQQSDVFGPHPSKGAPPTVGTSLTIGRASLISLAPSLCLQNFCLAPIAARHRKKILGYFRIRYSPSCCFGFLRLLSKVFRRLGHRSESHVSTHALREAADEFVTSASKSQATHVDIQSKFLSGRKLAKLLHRLESRSHTQAFKKTVCGCTILKS